MSKVIEVTDEEIKRIEDKLTALRFEYEACEANHPQKLLDVAGQIHENYERLSALKKYREYLKVKGF